MIINNDSKTEQPEPVSVETPPPYSPSSFPSESDGSTSRAPAAPAASAPPALAVANFVSIKRHNAPVKGAYLIDPSKAVPEAMLAPRAPGVPRRNLELDADNGSVNVDVWLVGPGPGGAGADAQKARRATVDVRAQNGYVTVKMHAGESHPFGLTITAKNGSVTVALPRAFCGPLTMHTVNGWPTISSTLAPHVTTFSDVKSMRKCFVGDFVSSNYGQGEWEGSSLDISCHNGRVKLYFVDEFEDQPDAAGGRGFLGRLLGLRF